MNHEFLQDLIIIFLLSLLVILLFRRFKMPAVLGFLVTGIIAGPHALALIKNVAQIEVIAEIGVILLLFTIGIEFSLKALIRTRRVVFLGGSLQVILTICTTAGILLLLGRSLNMAIFGGFITAMSSTAIVLKLLQERAEVQSSQGRAIMGILIFQDIAVVPMMLLIPMLSGNAPKEGTSLAILGLKIAGILLFLFVMVRWITPRLLHMVALMKRKDMFLLTLLLLAFSIAWLTSFIGLSLALGAFLAGLIISESEYHHHAFGDILPFRDLFSSFFFVSVGMLLDPFFLASHPVLVISLVLAVILGKSILGFLAIMLTGYSAATAIISSLAISQVGEFSFILAQIGFGEGLLPLFDYQLFLVVAVSSMSLSPFLMELGPRVALTLKDRFSGKRWIGGLRELKNPRVRSLDNHLVLIGFGRNGRNIAKAAGNAGILFAAIDFDAEKVRTARRNKELIFFGDASHEAVLKQVNLERAAVVVIAIADFITTHRILDAVRKMNPGAYLIIRTRYTEQMEDLYKLGADEVIPEEIETSVKIFTSVMARFLISKEEIEKYEAALRARGYEMLLSEERPKNLTGDSNSFIPDTEIASFRVYEGSLVAGKSLADSGIQPELGLTVLAIKRNEEIILSPALDKVLIPEDLVIVFGKSEVISKSASLYRKIHSGSGDLGTF
jgi:monovalent cation:H+ antiporter-2, CPA2 family